MRDYIIATSSTADIDRDWLDEHQIPFIPYTFVIDGQVIEDDCRERTKLDLFHAMREGSLPSTAQIPEYNYYEFFKSLLKQGKDVIFLDMSRAISNSYNNSELAASKARQEFPNQKLYVVDTRCITTGLAYLVVNLVNKCEKENLSFKDAIKWVEERKLKIVHHFMVDDLQWLRRGGRLSNASAVVGSLLNIKPILYVTDEGTLIASSKVRGKKQALLQMIKHMKKDIEDSTNKEIYIYHGDCLEDAWFVEEHIKKQFPKIGNITIKLLGPTIGAHVGPGFVSIIYEGSARLF